MDEISPFFVEPLIPLFWTSDDVCSGFQSYGGFSPLHDYKMHTHDKTVFVSCCTYLPPDELGVGSLRHDLYTRAGDPLRFGRFLPRSASNENIRDYF